MKPHFKLHIDGRMSLKGYVHPSAARTPEPQEGPSVRAADGVGTHINGDWHPEQIKANLRMKGTTPSALAQSLKCSRMMVSNVIHGRAVSRRVANAIGKLLGHRADQLWPGKYEPKRTSRRAA